MKSSRYFVLLMIAFIGLGASSGSKKSSIIESQGWQNKQKRLASTGQKISHSELQAINRNVQNALSQKALLKTNTSRKSSSRLRQVFKQGGYQPMKLSAAGEAASRLSDLNIYWHEKNRTPVFITGAGLQRQSQRLQLAKTASSAQAAIIYLAENRELFKLENPEQEMQPVWETADRLGMRHVQFQQVYHGVPLWKQSLVAHFDAEGSLYAINARYSPTPDEVDVTQFRLSSAEAVTIAEGDLGGKTSFQTFDDWTKAILGYEQPTAQKYIWVNPETQSPHLIWHVTVRPNLRDHWYYFIDAGSGAILESYNATNFDGPATANATDLNGVTRTIHTFELSNAFFMIDASRDIFDEVASNLPNDPRGALWTIDANGKDLAQGVELFHVTSANNTWNDAVSVSAHFNVGEVFQYYRTTHDRLAIDGNGSTIISIIHVTDDGQPMDNAFWNGVVMAYGDGNQAFDPLAGGLDVAAHEMTHGVIQHTVDLEYKFQSGALNESLADVFGVMVDRDDFKMGEDVVRTTFFPSGALRDLEDPHNGGNQFGDRGWQPAHMNEFVNLNINQDNGGVHVNSGIPNRACFLIADAIGREKTEQIYYRVLDAKYLNGQSNFVDMRLAAIRAATDLFGDPSAEVAAVKAGFDGVGIVGEEGTPPPPDTPPVEGEQFIAVVNAEATDNSLFLVNPDDGNDFFQLTPRQVFTGTGNPMAISDDGSVLMFVDEQNDIRLIVDGTESVIGDQGFWSSIALSPDATKLAATTVFIDTTIYVFDFVADIVKAVRLYTPTTAEGVKAENTLFADALDWDLSGEFLLYDAFNRIPQSGGGAIEYWDINVLDVENEIIFPIFEPQPVGINVANPSFAQTNDAFFVFDLIDLNLGEDEIRAVDLFNGIENLIEENGTSIGYPRYSPDDSRIVFERDEGVTPTIRQMPIAANRIAAAGPSVFFVSEAQRPSWFAVGERPTEVEEPPSVVPELFVLHQNYPNPFNPETAIRYELPASAQITLKIFDLKGRLVAELEAGQKEAGVHTARWNGRDDLDRPAASGVYFYRLEARSENGAVSQLSNKMTLLK